MCISAVITPEGHEILTHGQQREPGNTGGVQGRELASTRPGFKCWRRCHISVEFVVGSLLCSERLFFVYSGFPRFSKTIISKFQFDQE